MDDFDLQGRANMERISFVETHDTSAVTALEEARERRLQHDADARNEALRVQVCSEATAARLKGEAERRAALPRAGVGMAVAALGIGIAALLTLWGVSLLLKQPVSAKTTIVMQRANEKMAAADEMAVNAEKALAEAKALTEKLKGGAPKTVIDFSIFRHHQTDTLRVTTGWGYKKVSDTEPSSQWCFVELPGNLMYQIASNGVSLPFDGAIAGRAGVTEAQIQKALPECEWFQGTNLNIVVPDKR
jgi:hypothetical protein